MLPTPVPLAKGIGRGYFDRNAKQVDRTFSGNAHLVNSSDYFGLSPANKHCGRTLKICETHLSFLRSVPKVTQILSLVFYSVWIANHLCWTFAHSFHFQTYQLHNFQGLTLPLTYKLVLLNIMMYLSLF